MHIPIVDHGEGPLLLVGPEEAQGVTTALSLAGIRFREGDGDGAGCAGPVVVSLCLQEPLGGLQERVDRALSGL